jgi:hypothetical protein
LAEYARAFQTNSPSKSDPLGFYTTFGYQRLWDGVQVVVGYTLMIGLNERLAEENSILLAREVKEHDLLLDGILARTTEADIRLGLSDQVAFHSSGITAADMQTMFGIIQSGLLAWIGSNQ